jgi:hypothetical protein
MMKLEEALKWADVFGPLQENPPDGDGPALLALAAEVRRLDGLLGPDAIENIKRLRAFAIDVMEPWPHAGIDGGELQDIAVKHGLLIQETRTESCGENCACEEYGFPADCHRRIDWLLKPNVRADLEKTK